MKIAYSILIFLIFLCNCAYAGNKPLELSVLFDKNEYKQSEPIYLTFKIENRTNEPLYVNKRFFLNSEDSPKGKKEIYLTVISPSGEKLPFKSTYETGLPKTDYFVMLKPEEEVTSEHKQNLKGYFDIKSPGTYKIIAVYQNVFGKEIGIDAVKEKIMSNPVTIEIAE